MSSTLTGPRHVILDHELLGRLDPTSPRQEWVNLFQRTGLLSIDPQLAPSPIREVLLTLAAWPTADASQPVMERNKQAILLFAAGMVFAAGHGFFFSSQYPILHIVPLTLWAIAAWLVFGRTSQRDTTGQEREQRYAARAHAALRAMISRSFVIAVGDTIIEATPHLSWIEARLESLRNADIHHTRRAEELQAALHQVQSLNQRMGRPTHDAETAQIEASIAQEHASRRRIQELILAFRQRRTAYEQKVEELRIVATRRALSEQVDSLHAEAEASARALAEVEVDVISAEAEIRSLGDAILQEDHQVRAILEVVAMQRRPG